MSKLLSVACYVIAGFFLYMTLLLSFVSDPAAGKGGVMAVFAAMGAAFLLLGLGASGFTHWRRDVGVVLVSVALFMAFLVLTVACMLATPEVIEQIPDHKFGFFSDYWTGALSTGATLGIGLWLLMTGPRTGQPPVL